jgi:hypothetical protein
VSAFVSFVSDHVVVSSEFVEVRLLLLLDEVDATSLLGVSRRKGGRAGEREGGVEGKGREGRREQVVKQERHRQKNTTAKRLPAGDTCDTLALTHGQHRHWQAGRRESERERERSGEGGGERKGDRERDGARERDSEMERERRRTRTRTRERGRGR